MKPVQNVDGWFVGIGHGAATPKRQNRRPNPENTAPSSSPIHIPVARHFLYKSSLSNLQSDLRNHEIRLFPKPLSARAHPASSFGLRISDFGFANSYSLATNPRPMNDRRIWPTLSCRFIDSSINAVAQSAGRSRPISTTSCREAVPERPADAASAVVVGGFRANKDMVFCLTRNSRHSTLKKLTACQRSKSRADQVKVARRWR